MSVVLVLCEPIVDLVLEVDESFLSRYGLEDESCVRYDRARHGDLYEVVRRRARVLPGGIGQNTARVAQALSLRPGRTAFTGACGCDREAELMRAEAGQLHVRYVEVPGAATSACAVLVSRKTRGRSMVTRLDASNHFTAADLDWSLVHAARIVHAGGFTAASYPDVVTQVAQLCHRHPAKWWTTSLGAVWLVHKHTNTLTQWLSLANLAVGNAEEWQALAEATQTHLCGEATEGVGAAAPTTSEILLRVCESTKPAHGKPRIMVATRGAESTLVAYWSDGRVLVEEFCVEPAAEVEDTNGCGDAFLGAFLYVWSRGGDLGLCVEAGHRCALNVLRRTGCDFDLEDYKHELNAQLCFRDQEFSDATSDASTTMSSVRDEETPKQIFSRSLTCMSVQTTASD